jgi:hypothetical protein
MIRITLLKTFAAERSKITKPGIFALGVACIAASIVAAPDLATAATVYDTSFTTTGAEVRFPDPTVETQVGAGFRQIADQFQLLQNTALTGMAIYTRSGSAAVGQSVTIRLWNDNSSVPGTLLQSFTENLSVLDTDGINTTDLPDMRRAFANFTTPIQVSGNTPYWISMSGTRFSLGLVRSQAGTGTIPANASIALLNDGGFVGFQDGQDMPFLLYGQAATPVPTPALLPGLMGMGAVVWRKRKTKALASQSV